MPGSPLLIEELRLYEAYTRKKNWKRWGPYLSERQWGTVREDYSDTGEAWRYFPHDHARSRAYRWGEDGLLGICDRQARLCFGLALWNGRDPILKERLFGLTGPEGNHGEDVKELYYYLDSLPTHAYLKALYKYPQQAYPYADLVTENAGRGLDQPEYELLDTGVFDDNRYFDVFAEYAKASPNHILIRVTIANRGTEAAVCHCLPTLWARNTWSWGRKGEGYWPKPRLTQRDGTTVDIEHAGLEPFVFLAGPTNTGCEPTLLFTDNETNLERLYGKPNPNPYRKDAFHDYVVHGRTGAVNPAGVGTKVAAHYALEIPALESVTLSLCLCAKGEEGNRTGFGEAFSTLFEDRIEESNAFYSDRTPTRMGRDAVQVARQSFAGLLWSKQHYFYVVKDWLEGDPTQPPPSPERKRNIQWAHHLYNRDVISMPDKWEYPWYAAWDLAFHMLPMARIDPYFAKRQLELFLREWYMHPNGQIPAYEWALDDVNPPVHAWAAWRVYKMTAERGERDHSFLAHVFQKLLMNFTWWVNRKDTHGNNVFAGGFLGLDNIGVFDRSKPLPTGGHLEQADGTAWMAFYCGTMLSIALELARVDRAYEDLASKFFEHFLAIANAINTLGGSGLWDEEDGFYYDRLHVDGRTVPLKVRSMVGVIPLFAVELLDDDVIDNLPGFKKRMTWFMENRPDLTGPISCLIRSEQGTKQRLLAIPSLPRLKRVLSHLLDPEEFLSPYGVRSLSRAHRDAPYVFEHGGERYEVGYVPGESGTHLFGGNSNWRGPIWFPLNYLLIEALQRYHHFYGDAVEVECPTGSGRFMTLWEVSQEISRRLTRLFLPDEHGHRPCHGGDARYATDPHFRDLVLFYEYFDGDNGRGVGAPHQTGWTSLVTRCMYHLHQRGK